MVNLLQCQKKRDVLMQIRWTLLTAVALLLSGCGAKPIVESQSALVVFKSKQFKFADQGYLQSNEDMVSLELFSAGTLVGKFEIENLVCVLGEGCLIKSSFNSRFLSEAYPDDLLEHILRGKPIFEGKGIQKSEHGFEQHIVGDSYLITYKVSPKMIYFKDRYNKILIKIKKQ